MKRNILLPLLLGAALLLTSLLSACGGTDLPFTPSGQSEASPAESNLPDASSGTNDSKDTGTDASQADEPSGQTPESSAAEEPGEASEGLEYQESGGDLRVTGLGGCKDKDIVIPASVDGKPVTEIDDDAFKGTDITSVVIQRGVERIGESAFEGCSSLKSVSLPMDMKGIAEDAFSNCVSLQEIDLPRMDYIGSSAFTGCSSLKSVKIGGAPMFDSRVFSGCVSLKTVVFTGNAYSLGKSIFDGCTSLQEVTLPATLEEISGSAFSGCVNLETIRIPKTVVSVGSYAFSGTHLKTVDYEGTSEDWEKINVSAGNEALTGADVRFS